MHIPPCSCLLYTKLYINSSYLDFKSCETSVRTTFKRKYKFCRSSIAWINIWAHKCRDLAMRLRWRVIFPTSPQTRVKNTVDFINSVFYTVNVQTVQINSNIGLHFAHALFAYNIRLHFSPGYFAIFFSSSYSAGQGEGRAFLWHQRQERLTSHNITRKMWPGQTTQVPNGCVPCPRVKIFWIFRRKWWGIFYTQKKKSDRIWINFLAKVGFVYSNFVLML